MIDVQMWEELFLLYHIIMPSLVFAVLEFFHLHIMWGCLGEPGLWQGVFFWLKRGRGKEIL